MQEQAKELGAMARKVNKLKRDPKQFVLDSKAYVKAQKSADFAWAKLGSFVFVLLASILVVTYYWGVASPRYVSETQFMVKQANSSESMFSGLAAIGSVTGTMRDALVLKTFIESREMAMALNEAVSLKSHYERGEFDFISRLKSNSTVEEYVKYYQNHISVIHDELSDVLYVEVQTLDHQYSLQVAETLLSISERFINDLGAKMAQEQVRYAQQDVERAYAELKKSQRELISFQDKFKLYNPEQQGGALVTVINELESEIIRQQTELKSLLAFMRDDAPEVKAKNIRINSLERQLEEEKDRLTNQDQQSLNKINVDFQEIKLNAELASDLYKTSLASLEVVRSEAYRKLKHLLVVEHPALAEEDTYPRRIHSIVTWFVCLVLIYLMSKLILAIVKEHKE